MRIPPRLSRPALGSRIAIAAVALLALASCGTSTEGKVVNLDGEGVADAWLLLSSVNPETGAIHPLQSTRSGRNGFYHLSNLEPGNYLIDALDVGDAEFDAEVLEATIVSGSVSPDFDSGRRFLRLDKHKLGATITTIGMDIEVGTSTKGGVHVVGQLNGRNPGLQLPYSLYVTLASEKAGRVARRSAICNEAGRFDLGYLPESVTMIDVEDLIGFRYEGLDLAGQSEVEVTIDLPHHELVRITAVTRQENAWLTVRSAPPDSRVQVSTTRSEAEFLLVEGDYIASLQVKSVDEFVNGEGEKVTQAFTVSPSKPTPLIELKL